MSKKNNSVGYCLSKYGQQDSPNRLETDKWNEAYRMFNVSLDGSRSVLEFEHRLKTSRDGYDSYFSETNR